MKQRCLLWRLLFFALHFAGGKPHGWITNDNPRGESSPDYFGFPTSWAFLLGIASVLLAISLGGPAVFAEEVPDSCQSSDCHEKMGQKKFVHGPTATGDCKECHLDTKSETGKHTFKLVATGADLCYNCHEPLPLDKVVHDPVNDGDCISCHDPHESQNRYMLVAPVGPKLCFDCHDEQNILEHKVLHEPVAKGDCLGCHRPHSSPNKHLLKALGKDLCFTCHDDIQAQVTTQTQVHDPLEDGCNDCHKSHGSAFKYLLKTKSSISNLCFKCHDEIEALTKSSVKHSPMTSEDECLNCHDPHASNFHPLLKQAPLDLCLGCHDEPITKDGIVLANMSQLLKDNPDHHGPIRKKDCSKCHNPHGSNSFRLLKNNYPAKFYAPFSFDNFALCFDCHEKDIFLGEKTNKLTEFRNGDQNLHFLHVNRKEKGRTCRACHETHGSKLPKHIRSKVPFGKWELPTNFRLTETGGSCQPGCHKAKQYDRDHPVKY